MILSVLLLHMSILMSGTILSSNSKFHVIPWQVRVSLVNFAGFPPTSRDRGMENERADCGRHQLADATFTNTYVWIQTSYKL